MSVDGFGLTGPQRHALTQTVAAERLEGWVPTAAHIAALTGLLRGTVTFDDYLEPHLTACGPPTRRRVFARRKPYLLPGSTVLRNNFGVHDGAVLAQLEFVATAGRMLQVHLRCEDSDLDVHRLHRHVFGDVYAWAGEPRIVELRRGGSVFGSCGRMPEALESLGTAIESAARVGASLDDGALSYQLARIYADYNQIHPFREGNGRTGTLLLHMLSGRAGRRLHLEEVSRDEWIAASRDSMPFRRDGRADARPLMAVLHGRLRPEDLDRSDTAGPSDRSSPPVRRR